MNTATLEYSRDLFIEHNGLISWTYPNIAQSFSTQRALHRSRNQQHRHGSGKQYKSERTSKGEPNTWTDTYWSNGNGFDRKVAQFDKVVVGTEHIVTGFQAIQSLSCKRYTNKKMTISNSNYQNKKGRHHSFDKHTTVSPTCHMSCTKEDNGKSELWTTHGPLQIMSNLPTYRAKPGTYCHCWRIVCRQRVTIQLVTNNKVDCIINRYLHTIR